MKKFLAAAFMVITSIPSQAQAALLTCTEGDQCDFCELIHTLDNIILWVVSVAILIAVIGLMYSGFRMSSSRGNVSTFTDAKDMLVNIIIGLFIIMAAWMIVDTILKTVVGGDFGVWNDPQECGSGMFGAGQAEQAGPLTTTGIEVVAPAGYVNSEEGPGSVIDPGGGVITPYVNDGTGGSVSFSFSSSLAIAQQGHLSSSLAALQTCIAGRVPGGTYVITSVSDNQIANGSRTWEQCATSGCAHTINSCHYGGQNCVGRSYALDIRTSNLNSSQRSGFLEAARACGGYGQDEGNHLHVSIGQAAGCGCY